MKFHCKEKCHDSANVRTYHMDMVYDLSPEEAQTLMEVGHIRPGRLEPVDAEAKAFAKSGKMPKIEVEEGPKPKAAKDAKKE